ncbi:unnamed protein product [Victoria cruziana]
MGNMDASEVEESVFAITDAKLHGGMCRKLTSIVCKVMAIFPIIEEARPRCKSGIQALCSLHVALEKSKSLLQHCADCSKLYLAITGDSVLLKFEKTRLALEESLKRVEDIVPHVTSCQIMSIVKELQGTVFLLDPLERQVGDDVILLLHQDRNCGTNFNEMSELEAFHQAAIKLGIISLASALAERRALKKLVEMARCENDKRKEIIVSYLLHLMRKYSKIFRSECPDDVDSQGSTPCSPTVHGSVEEGVGSAQAIDGQLLKFGSLNINPNGRRSGNLPVTPEEFRCPISLQLMYDPVIIASGQTYERVCIENWFSHGHDTCPKTQQKLSHLYLTPNYCVKGLIGSWCEQNGVSFPDQPPDSLDLDYWKWNLSQCENINTGSTEDDVSGLVKESKFVPLVDNDDFDGPEKHDEMGTGDNCLENIKISPDQGYQRLLGLLNSEEDIKTKCKAAEEIRFLLKDNEEARICMGENGFANPLVGFLRTGIQERNEKAQETGTMALFNLAVGNDRFVSYFLFA